MTTARTFVAAEFAVIFILMPVVIFFDWIPIPKIPALLVLTLYCFLTLWLDTSYSTRRFIRWEVPSGFLKTIMIRFLLISGLLFLAVWVFQPQSFLAFPKSNFRLWLLVMFLYPFLSALPQELIYRSFFFHRYKPLFSGRWGMVAVNVLCFAWLHIIYDNWVAVAFTLAGGMLFALNFDRNRSLPVVTLEHALYGCAVFTSGLGRYFYEPFS